MVHSDDGISRRKALQKGGIAIGGAVIGLSSVSTTAVAAPTEIEECGAYSDGEFVLTEDITTTGDCFQLGSETVLDGNGHTISGDGTGAGISMGESTVRIRNLTVTDFETGIQISTSGSSYAADLTVENADISNTSTAISGNYAPRISVQESEIHNNGVGIRGGEAARISITQSTVRDNDGNAVATGLGNTMEVSESTIEANGAGINAGEGTFTDNTIRNNDGDGVRLIGLVAPTDIGETTIVGNDIQENAGAGIRFVASNGVVQENTITDNQNGIIISFNIDEFGGAFPDTYEVVNNTIANNAEFGLQNRLTEIEDVDDEDFPVPVATCNYWGDATGPQYAENPTENPQGDPVSNDVEVIPWSVTEIQDGESICFGGNPIGEFQEQPTDPDGDGLYEDINGDGESNIVDVQALFSNRNDETIQNNTNAFDFNGDGSINVVDVQRLFSEI